MARRIQLSRVFFVDENVKQAPEILALRQDGETIQSIAKETGIDEESILRVIRGFVECLRRCE